MSESRVNYINVYASLIDILKAQASGGVALRADLIREIHNGLIEAAEKTIKEDNKT